MATSTPPAPGSGLLDEPLPGEGFVLAAAMGAAMAGVVHLLVVPGHWATSPLMSVFFVAIGTAQLVLVVLLSWRLPNAVIVGVIVGHLAIMGMYLASRTVDLPFVPPRDRATRRSTSPSHERSVTGSRSTPGLGWSRSECWTLCASSPS